MAVNLDPYAGNLIYPEIKLPLKKKVLFQAGATQAIKRGEICAKTASTNTKFTPIAADSDFSTVKLVIAAEEIQAGDKEGYYWAWVPRPGDVWEFDLASASNPAIGAALYYSTSQALALSGSNALGYSVGDDHIPKQEPAVISPYADAGVTLRNMTKVKMGFRLTYSLWSAMFPLS